MTGNCKVEQQVAALGDLPREDLVERWTKLYGCPPPAGTRRELLHYAAGWHLQARRLGGFSRDVKRALTGEVERIKRKGSTATGAALGDKDPVPSSVGAVTQRLVPGSRLLREWNGQNHIVDLTEDGYLYHGTRYRSLSAIARQITGAHWSGPRFFGR